MNYQCSSHRGFTVYLRRQEERLTRHQKEVIAMEKEISELMWLIALAKKQRAAIDEEVLNKKCEMKFLKKEGLINFMCTLFARQTAEQLFDKNSVLQGDHMNLGILKSCSLIPVYIYILVSKKKKKKKRNVYAPYVFTFVCVRA